MIRLFLALILLLSNASEAATLSLIVRLPRPNGTIVFYDTFTEASGTPNLSAHTPETGTWGTTQDEASGNLLVDSATDELKAANNTDIYYFQPTASPISRNLTIGVRTKMGGSTHATWTEIFMRGDYVNDNFFKGKIYGDGMYSVFRVDAGVATLLSSATIAGFSTSTYYNMEMADDSSTNLLAFRINGTQVWSNVVTEYSTQKEILFSIQNAGVRVDSMTVTQN